MFTVYAALVAEHVRGHVLSVFLPLSNLFRIPIRSKSLIGTLLFFFESQCHGLFQSHG